MKKISILLLVFVAALASCKKTPEVNLKYVDVERDLVTVGATTATFQCDYDYITTLKKAYLYYGEGEDETDMASAEMQVVQKTLYAELTDLKENTTYSYYYEFFNGFNSMRSSMKTFKTEMGLFTVNENGDQVHFSKGNLQYQASTNTWRFAEHQWDVVGGMDTVTGIEYGNVYDNGVKCDNALISATYSGWIDLYGWGTSGWNNGNCYYHPYDIGVLNDEYQGYGYGPTDGSYYKFDLAGLYVNSDWGIYNPISNERVVANIWRTPTWEEFDYVFNNRSTESGLRFAKAIVNEVKGVILLPDNWNANNYYLNNANQNDISFTSNVITISTWLDVFESNGAIFIPVAGIRKSTYYDGTNGHYWSASSFYDSYGAYDLDFGDYFLETDYYGCRYYGHAVRLVQDVNP